MEITTKPNRVLASDIAVGDAARIGNCLHMKTGDADTNGLLFVCLECGGTDRVPASTEVHPVQCEVTITGDHHD